MRWSWDASSTSDLIDMSLALGVDSSTVYGIRDDHNCQGWEGKGLDF
jgi:hypothetical protein